MSDIKISQLTSASSLVSTDLFEVSQDLDTTPVSRSASISQISSAVFNNVPQTNTVYVSQTGADLIGAGGILQPYATVSYALSQIISASQSNPFSIKVLGGHINDSGTILLKPNISIIGEGQGTIINNSSDIGINVSAWNSGGENSLCYLQDITVINNINFNCTSVTTFPGLQFNNVLVRGNVNTLGNSGSLVNLYVVNSNFYNQFYMDNFNCLSFSNNYFNLSLGTISNAANSFITSQSDIIEGGITASSTNSNRVVVFLTGATLFDSPILTGSGVYFNSDSSSIAYDLPVLSGGANLFFDDDGASINSQSFRTNYTPTSGTVEGNFEGIDTALGSLQPSGSYITALTGDVAASGPGSATSTIQPGVVTSSKIASNTIVDSNINSSAAITYSKINSSTLGTGYGLIVFSGGTVTLTNPCPNFISLQGTSGTLQLPPMNAPNSLSISNNSFIFLWCQTSGSVTVQTNSGITTYGSLTNGQSMILYPIDTSTADGHFMTSYVALNATLPLSIGGGVISMPGISSTSSALLSMSSTTQGFKPPSMTTSQMNAISSPATGLMIYDTVVNAIRYYNGSAWSTSVSVDPTIYTTGFTLSNNYENVLINNAPSTPITVTLPLLSTVVPGTKFRITKIATNSSNTITCQPNGSDVWQPSGSHTILGQYTYVSAIHCGTFWQNTGNTG